MAIASQISIIYLVYGSLFHLELEPCLSKPTLTAVEFLFKKWFFSFNIRYIWMYIGLVFSYSVVVFFLVKPHYYVRTPLKVALLLLYVAGIICRIMGGSGAHIALTKESVFGKCGQILLLMISIIFLIVDVLFAVCIKKEAEVPITRKHNKVNDFSSS